MTRYRITLIDGRRNLRKVYVIDADTALDAIKQARSKDTSFWDVESCVPVKFLG